MTNADCNTQQQTPPFVFVLPDLAANIAAAQQAGGANCEQADAYHYAFTAAMRTLGTPMPCACDACTAHKVSQ